MSVRSHIGNALWRLRFVALAVCTFSVALAARGDALTTELDNGLRYIRLPDASVIATFEGTQVVDLRFTDALEESADGLARHLQTAAQSGATLFVLVNSATDPLLRRDLATVQGTTRSLLFIGPATPELAPEIVTASDLEEERRACDAIVAGTSPAELIKEELDKQRFDEAELLRTRANGAGRTTESAAQTASDTEEKPPPLKDLSLQRAVFLHRALIALGRIQPAA